MRNALLILATLVPRAAASQAPATPSAVASNHWVADPANSAVNFRVRHLGITWVNGTFGQWTADFTYDPNKPEAANVTARIRTASVSTGNDRRDNDLRTNYLAVDSFPEMTFVSKRVEQVGPDRLRITGDLTIRGVTHEAVLDTEIGGIAMTPAGRRTAFSATTTIKRQEFSITRNPFLEGTQMVGDEVRITIDVEAVQR
jgi:polyisoprenoid-binding protein YceI